MATLEGLLLIYAIIGAFGYMHRVNAECNLAKTTDVLERAFGPVISTRLEDQSEEIKATLRSGLGEQFGRLETSVVEVNATLIKLSEDLVNKIEDDGDLLKQEMNTKFEDQNIEMSKQLEDHAEKLVEVSEALVKMVDNKIGYEVDVLKQDMNSKFEDQNVNMTKQFENHAEKLVKQSEDLVKVGNKIGDEVSVLRQEMSAKFEDQFENLVERFNQLLESKLEEQARSMYEKYTNLLCPNGWVLLGDSCIFIPNELASFDNAANKCSELASNSRLYEPPTRSHYDLVDNLVESSESTSEHSIWIGIRKISSS